MCTELGNNDYMQAYVEEAGETSLCSVGTGDGCTDKEKKFIATFSAKSQEDVAKQVAHLQKMSEGIMKAELMPVSYTHLRAHETVLDLVCRLLLEKKKKTRTIKTRKNK
eukprot:TRINITY_DN6144_c0_g1_i3.p2 TRINITY_DN6144_c0_g1~~TRINITY_DN6144_c0_g1_i3.p2  ORF type:complete len:109 (-),score=16.48 TRINITY_DN6144_c0_g1_i3:11-337(-)